MSDQRCPACGSDKIMSDVPIRDRGSQGRGLEVEVATNLEAIVFRGTQWSKLVATICGQCGYAMLHVTHPGRLWEAWVARHESQE